MEALARSRRLKSVRFLANSASMLRADLPQVVCLELCNFDHLSQIAQRILTTEGLAFPYFEGRPLAETAAFPHTCSKRSPQVSGADRCWQINF